MIDRGRTVCVCNDASIEKVAECIKKQGIESLEELIGNSECPVGDKCEQCIEEGYENDGCSLAMVLAQTLQGRL